MSKRILEDKIIFITGGSSGIGWECAKGYKHAGAKVVILSDDAITLDIAIKQLGDPHMGIQCDVSKADQVEKAIQKTLIKYGRIDAIHNNAGIANPAKQLHLTTDAEWELLFNINLKGIYHTIKYGLDALKESEGAILNTSSLVGEIGQENHAAYAATKGAINSLTKSMALDYAIFKIRVNALAPAAVWTPMLRKWNQEQTHPEIMEQYLTSIHPLNYCPEGDVIADAAVFLLSEKSRFITGCILPVSGGAELGYRKVL